jgi:hypothetical protein
MQTVARPRAGATQTRPVTYPYQTVKQLKRLHPDQWVLLLNPVWKGHQLEGGQFVTTAAEEMAMLGEANSLPKGSRITLYFTGKRELPADAAICL